MVNKKMLAMALFLISIVFILSSVSALNATICCEKTKSNLFCQNIPIEECAAGARQVPSSCESTSYCKKGTCYNSKEGTCLDNTPEIVCNANGGVWSADKPGQCNLGCCILGDQASFVTLTRCKYLASMLGLKTDYNKAIKDEVQCVLQVTNQDKGACVFDSEFERTCKFTTRQQCLIGFNSSKSAGEFFKNKLCSSPELETNCGPSKKTACVAGRDEVYFIDTCGNAANIYDSGKIDDQEYWTNYKTNIASCGFGSSNANSKSCGNCNYLLGSYCRPSSLTAVTPNNGDYVCGDLNCKKTANGKSYKHGESWCVYDDEGKTGVGNNAVGSQFFKHICINGQEVLETCADYRAHECIEDKIQIPGGGEFSQAACRVNRWQDCLLQTEKDDCVNTDKRDCLWRDDMLSVNATTDDEYGACIPKNTPGLKFWEGDTAKGICQQGSIQCVVKFEEGLFGGKECTENCECLTESWKELKIEFCQALGDCGLKINWVGENGYKLGYNLSIKEA